MRALIFCIIMSIGSMVYAKTNISSFPDTSVLEFLPQKPKLKILNNAVGIDLGKIPLLVLKLHYERVLSDFISLEFAGSTSYQTVQLLGFQSKLLVLGADAGVKYYFPNAYKIAPNGWYGTAFIRIENFSVNASLPKNSAQLVSGINLSPGLRVGHQFNLGSIGLLDIGLGTVYQHAKFQGRFTTVGKFILIGHNGITPSWKVSFSKTF